MRSRMAGTLAQGGVARSFLADRTELGDWCLTPVAPATGYRRRMETLSTLTYEVTGRIARITLNRPERGNGITLALPGELAAVVERANLDPAVHVIALAGNGKGFCGGYDLAASAESGMQGMGGGASG